MSPRVELLVDRVAAEVVERLRLPTFPPPPEMDEPAVAGLAARLADHLVPALLPVLAETLAAQISERTARQLLADCELPSLLLSGARRVDSADIDACMAARRERSWLSPSGAA